MSTEQLIHASKYGHVEIVRALLGMEEVLMVVDAVTVFHNKATALILASKYGHVEIVRMLLDVGADTDAVDCNGWTAVMFASREKNTDIMGMLLDNGADVHAATSTSKITALMIASERGHLSIVRMLLDAGAHVDAATPTGWTALFFASRYGHVDVVRTLIVVDANVLATTTSEVTALMIASFYGHAEVVRLLLDMGADVSAARSAKKGWGWNALFLASKEGHAEVVRILLDAGASVDDFNIGKETTLMIASEHGHAEVVRILIDADANVAARDSRSWTALHIASRYGHAEVVGMFLDMEEATVEIDRALMIASDYGRTEIVRLLLDAGADVNAVDDSNRTALMIARSHVEVVRLLLDANADVDVATGFGMTALIFASMYGCTKVVQLLLEAGANVNAVDHRNMTALMSAIMRDRAGIIRVFIEAGVDVDAVNPDGLTALMIASQAGRADAVRLLLEAGADVDVTDRRSSTSLIFASMHGHAEVVRLLATAVSDGTVATAAFIANQYRHPEVVRVLVEAFARGESNFALAEASLMARADTDVKKWFELTEAIEADDVDAVRRLAPSVRDINIVPSFIRAYNSVLHRAFTAEIAQILIDNGAHASVIGFEGYMPLFLALEERRDGFEVAKVLLRRMIDTDVAVDRHSILLAVRINNMEILELMAEARADFTGSHALHGVFTYETLDFLLTHGADPKACSPLHYILHIGGFEQIERIIRRLVDVGADVNGLDRFGHPPLHYHAEHPDIVALFVSLGADIYKTDTEGRNLLHYICTTYRLNERTIRTVEYLLNDLRMDTTVRDGRGLRARDYIDHHPELVEPHSFVSPFFTEQLRVRMLDVFDGCVTVRAAVKIQACWRRVLAERIFCREYGKKYDLESDVLHPVAYLYHPRAPLCREMITEWA